MQMEIQVRRLATVTKLANLGSVSVYFALLIWNGGTHPEEDC